MTFQSEILNDPHYVPLLDHGFVGLVDSLGGDHSITRAARVSYGTGTKSVSSDRGLIRYLLRMGHSSPLEMCEFVFCIKLPIFVMRQVIRHRTMSTNEHSGRYSVMPDEFYLPDPNEIQPQSATNRQGRAGAIDDVSKDGVTWLMQEAAEHAFQAYHVLLGERAGGDDEHFDPYASDQPLLTGDFSGISRELARTVLPVSGYTEAYIKMNLWNLFRFLRLRMDNHAQYEIRVYADAMYELIKPIVPLACEAFEDYILQSKTLSRMDQALLGHVMREVLPIQSIETWIAQVDRDAIADRFGMSRREVVEFAAWLIAASA
jgi:thymidylate synthase (FAD)